MKPLKLLIWDLDGTITNSLGISISAIREGAEPFTGRPLSDADITSHFGQPDDLIVRKLAGSRHGDEAASLMYRAFERKLGVLKLYDGIADALEGCTRKGIKLALLTGRGRVTADMILKYLQIQPHFSVVMTGTELTRWKPDPEGPLAICNRLGIAPHEASVIGDTIADVGAGRAMGAAITFGCVWDEYCDKTALAAARPTHILSHPRELGHHLGF